MRVRSVLVKIRLVRQFVIIATETRRQFHEAASSEVDGVVTDTQHLHLLHQIVTQCVIQMSIGDIIAQCVVQMCIGSISSKQGIYLVGSGVRFQGVVNQICHTRFHTIANMCKHRVQAIRQSDAVSGETVV